MDADSDADFEKFRTAPGAEVTVAGIGVGGKPESPESPYCLAKVVTSGGGVKYLVRQDTSGQFFNPQTTERERLLRNDLGRPHWDFREVSRESFFHYRSFLAGGNPADLYLSQRK